MSKFNLENWAITEDTISGNIEISSLVTGETFELTTEGNLSSSSIIDGDTLNGNDSSDFIRTSRSPSAGVNHIKGSSQINQFDEIFSGSIQLPQPDGRVVFTPKKADTVGLFDPSDNTYSAGPSHNESIPSSFGGVFVGSALAPDGRIIFGPDSSDNIGIFDPSDDSFSLGPSFGSGKSIPVRLRDGRILLNDGDSKVLKIFDPSDDSLTNGPTYLESEQHDLIGRAPDGRVFYNGAFPLRVFDPADDSFERFEVDYSGLTLVNMSVSVGISGGRFLIIGADTNPAITLNSQTLEVEETSFVPENEGLDIFFNYALQLLPDGRIMIIDDDAEAVFIYDVVADEVIESTAIESNEVDAYSDSTLLHDGRVILCPHEVDTVDAVYQLPDNTFAATSNY